VRRLFALAAITAVQTVAAGGCASADGDEGSEPPGARLVRIGSFDAPTYVAAPPGDRKRLFITEREGRIVVLHAGRRSTFLDITARVQTGGESGLLSMAFHPDYARNRRYFVYYVDRAGAIVIAQFRARASGDATDPGSGRLVLRQPHGRFNHKGGQLQFGPDGMLYAGLGDGGGAGDPDGNAQDLSTLLGKLIRIAPQPGGGYRVPSDNPFVGRSGARGEIFAYGLRNPFRFSFDRRGADLAIGDVGQGEFEEIDLLAGSPRAGRPRGGANFGWSVFEGRSRFREGDAPGHVEPVIERSHDDGSCAIAGGYVIRDRSLSALRGFYVYGDLCNDRLRIARLRPGGAVADRPLGPRVPQLVSFGEDALGRVYAVSLGGDVFRLARPRGSTARSNQARRNP
jgi:glucose/arabinose dehydrogenase